MSRRAAVRAERGADRLVHDAFVYSSRDEFLAGALPIIRDGLALGEPVLAAPTSANGVLLRRELGDDARRVDWADDPESHKPVERLGIFVRFIADHVDRGASRVRLIGEPVWPAGSDSGVAEWKRYESFLNVALAPYPVWLVCTYDGRELAETIVADACRTHPVMGHGDQRRASDRYVDPGDFARRLDEKDVLSPPPADAVERSFDSPAGVRRFVVEQAEAARLARDKVADAKLAAGEVAANVFRHASALARVRTWLSSRTFVCEVSDTGPGIADPFAGYGTADPTQSGGWGLAIVRHICDVVEIRSNAAGTTVRLHMQLA